MGSKEVDAPHEQSQGFYGAYDEVGEVFYEVGEVFRRSGRKFSTKWAKFFYEVGVVFLRSGQSARILLTNRTTANIFTEKEKKADVGASTFKYVLVGNKNHFASGGNLHS